MPSQPTLALTSPSFAAGSLRQYCNHGTLGDAVDRGWLLNRRDRASGPNMLAVLHTAMVRLGRQWGAEAGAFPDVWLRLASLMFGRQRPDSGPSMLAVHGDSQRPDSLIRAGWRA